MQSEDLKSVDSELIEAIAKAPSYPYFQPGTGHSYVFPESDETIKVLDELNLFRLNLPQYEIERAVDAKINPPTERK